MPRKKQIQIGNEETISLEQEDIPTRALTRRTQWGRLTERKEK
jgi:hypothetical protein